MHPVQIPLPTPPYPLPRPRLVSHHPPHHLARPVSGADAGGWIGASLADAFQPIQEARRGTDRATPEDGQARAQEEQDLPMDPFPDGGHARRI
jgi:hypothetical protein